MECLKCITICEIANINSDASLTLFEKKKRSLKLQLKYSREVCRSILKGLVDPAAHGVTMELAQDLREEQIAVNNLPAKTKEELEELRLELEQRKSEIISDFVTPMEGNVAKLVDLELVWDYELTKSIIRKEVQAVEYQTTYEKVIKDALELELIDQADA